MVYKLLSTVHLLKLWISNEILGCQCSKRSRSVPRRIAGCVVSLYERLLVVQSHGLRTLQDQVAVVEEVEAVFLNFLVLILDRFG